MDKNTLLQLLAKVKDISRETGNWMAEQVIVKQHIEEKTFNNLVTYVDKESEKKFVEALSKLFPEAGFVAEEGTGERNLSGINWVIDPLDGTTNFVHGVPVWCTSIALTVNDQPVLGVIYDPKQKELFSAVKGSGAWLNGERITTSDVHQLSTALLATGFPYDDFGRQDQYFRLLKDITRTTRGMRRLGSAALDMAWTACGRLDGFYEYGLSPWDIVAGTIIIREAGGTVTTFNGNENPVFGNDIICSNPHIYGELKAIIEKHFS